MAEKTGDLSRSSMAQHASFLSSLKGVQESSQQFEILRAAEQADVASEKLANEAEENTAMGIHIRTQKLERRKETPKTERAKEVQESILVRKEDADGLAQEFSQRQGNREYRLDPRLLRQLLMEELGITIHEESEPEAILLLIRRRMTAEGEEPDVAVVDKTLEFLLEVTHSQFSRASASDQGRIGQIAKRLEEAKAHHFAIHHIDIQVAQKIIGAVDAVATMSKQSVNTLLNHYRELVHNPTDLQSLRRYYEQKGYHVMILEMKGLSNYLGLNLKRNHLDNPELARLNAAGRQMQALLGVWRAGREWGKPMLHYLQHHHVVSEAK